MALASQNRHYALTTGLIVSFALLLAIAASLQPAFAQARVDREPMVIGEVALVKGGVNASSEMRNTRNLMVGKPIYLGDVIETDRLSFVVISFVDGGKLTLQPSSKVDLQEFNSKVAQESQTFELLKGSLRAITGAISKRRPHQVTYVARGTTIGIRGTTLAIRLCREGAQSCKFDRGINYQGRIVANEPEGREVRLFIRGRDSERRRRISREDLGQYLTDTFVWVIEGKISVLTGDYAIDMEVAIGPQDQSPAATEPGQRQPPARQQAPAQQQPPGQQDGPKQPAQKANKPAPPSRPGKP